MKNFALIGAAGYIAPRHMKAIKDTGNNLVAIYDKSDSVGIIDSYFPEANFFTEFERFDRHLYKLKRNGTKIDYISICSPNYLHDAHIRFALRLEANVICEKPLVLNPWNLDALREMETGTGKKINTILQLRLHPALINLKEKIDSKSSDKKHDVVLTYITTRGNWYYSSWKGDISKSGGIATNIGIHFYDLLSWLFGNTLDNTVNIHTHDRAAGYLRFDRANVSWFLSINSETLPSIAREKQLKTYRSITIDGDEIEFSDGFADLHTVSYQEILKGKGFGLDEAANSVKIAYEIRNSKQSGLVGKVHDLAKLPLAPHPFSA